MHSRKQPSVAVAALIIAVGAAAAYANTFRVPFLFDDIPSIENNPTIRQLWPPGEMLSPPADWGFTVSGRPLLNVSFAINYAISGLEVWSYHLLNLVIHICAGLTLLGIVRRTLLRPPLAETLGGMALPLALVIAAVWTLHPLQPESVTYIVQRAESLMGLFFLLSLYAFIRSVDSPRPLGWRITTVLSCFLGVATKEVSALIPVMVFLYDRTFVSGTFMEALRRHRWVHFSLVLTWVPLAWLIASTGGNRGGTMGFGLELSLVGYWLIQFEAVTRYLWLSFWPHPLVFDYGRLSPPGGLAVIFWALPVVTLAVATLVALRRWPVPGFLGAWFFAILAPTSLVPGGNQMIVEHRMYLPLAAVLALVFGYIARRHGHRALVSSGIFAAVVAGAVTFHRNTIYQVEERLWLDTIAKVPGNARAHNNLGRIYYARDELDPAVERYRESLRLDASIAHTHFNLGIALMKKGELEEAMTALREAVRILPYYYNAQLNLGIVLTRLGRHAEAILPIAQAIRHDPSPAEAYFRMGVALAGVGRWREADANYAATQRLNPGHVEAHSNRGVALYQMNQAEEAISHFNEALRLQPDLPDVHFNLGLALASIGRSDDARDRYQEAVRLNPDHALAHLNLGIALAQIDRLDEGLGHMEEAVRLLPASAEARGTLAQALTLLGRNAESLIHYEAVVDLRPGDPGAHFKLANALARERRWMDARRHAEEVLRLDPRFVGARELLLSLP